MRRFPAAAALAALVWIASPGLLRAQDSAEARAFKAASDAFEDKIYDKAEKELAQFIQAYPQSPLVPKAILLQAQAALSQQKPALAVDLLTTNSARAGPLAEEYRYQLARAQMGSGNYLAAAESFSLFTREFTNSVLLLEASHGEALARFKLKDWPRVITLLQPTNSTFQQAARVRPNDQHVPRGHLLLAEALIEQKDYRGAEQTLTQLGERDLIPESKWWRQYHLCRTQLADRRPEAALANTTNLLVFAAATGKSDLQAESVALQGAILEQLNQVEAAAQAYEKNLGENVPPERRRQAHLKVIELKLAQKKLAEAAQRLESFFAKYPNDPALDVTLLTLGELYLREYLPGLETNRMPAVPAVAPAPTNHLAQARAQFDKLIQTYTNSPLLGKAHLNRGWCLAADGKIPESQAAFETAAGLLPRSEDQAVARFKLADAQFFLENYSNALQNYRVVITNYLDVPRVQTNLLDQALYQVVRASLKLSDRAGARQATQQLLKEHPASPYRDRSLLLVGQSFTQAGQPEEARAVLADCVRQIPDSPLRAEVELAIARTYVQQKDWTNALAKYDEGLGRLGTNTLRPRAEFDRAWALYQAGIETNALHSYTNFLARFPTHELAPLARFWVAEHYYRQKDYVNAEENYQRLFQNWPGSELAPQARMMAGRVAFARQSFPDARKYFTELINVLIKSTNNPPPLLAEAYFALGDTIFEQFIIDPAKPQETFREAINALTLITKDFPTHPQAALAWGRMGDCYLQAGNYDKAIEAYQKVLAPEARADAAARSRAEFGWAQVLEKQAPLKPAAEAPAILNSAFEHYYDIVREKNLRAGEKPDPFWLKEAGLAAARLAEDRKQWEIAVRIYERLKTALPTLGPVLDKRIEKARERIPADKD